MALQLRYEALAGLLKVHAAGEATLADIFSLIDTVAQRTRGSGHKNALLNLLDVKEGLQFTDHYSIGEYVVRELGHLAMLASVVPAERRTGTSEKVASAQGMRLRVFVSEAAALAWLHHAQAEPT